MAAAFFLPGSHVSQPLEDYSDSIKHLVCSQFLAHDEVRQLYMKRYIYFTSRIGNVRKGEGLKRCRAL